MPVPSLLHILLTLSAHLFLPRYSVRLQILLFQLQMLKKRLKGARVVATPEEKTELLRLGALLDHDLNGMLQIVQPETYRKWRQQSAAGVPAKPLGRKGLAKEVRELIVRLAKENILWGHRRIVGELKKLGHEVAASSVKRIMNNSGIHPTPGKGSNTPPSDWTRFVHAHMETLLACDFFTKPVYTIRGRFEAYVLIVIHLGTRKVYRSPATRHPDNAWVVQQARNASIWLAGEGERAEMLIHDADTKFSAEFKRVEDTLLNARNTSTGSRRAEDMQIQSPGVGSTGLVFLRA